MQSSSLVNARQKDYKRGLDVSRASLQRKADTASLRQTKKAELISAKRMKFMEPADEPEGESMEEIVERNDQDIIDTLRQMEAPSPAVRKTALINLRKITYSRDALPLIVAAGAIETLQAYIQSTEYKHQYEAAWCLTNIAAGSHDLAEAVYPTIPHLISYLGGMNEALQVQCAWALGNVAGDCVQCRDVVMANGALLPLVNLLDSASSAVACKAAFAICNLCRGQDFNYEAMFRAGIAPKLVTALHSEDINYAMEMAWIAPYLAYVPDPHASEALLNAGIGPALVHALNAPHIELVLPAVRTVGVIAASPNEFALRLFGDGVTPCLVELWQKCSDAPHIRKEILWCLSSFAACGLECVTAMLDLGVIPAVLEGLNSSSIELAREAAYVLVNMVEHRKDMLIDCLNENLLPVFVGLADMAGDPVATDLGLTFIEWVVQSGPEGSAAAEGCGAVDALGRIAYENADAQLAARASRLLQAYQDGAAS